jgi:hypothetical protein
MPPGTTRSASHRTPPFRSTLPMRPAISPAVIHPSAGTYGPRPRRTSRVSACAMRTASHGNTDAASSVRCPASSRITAPTINARVTRTVLAAAAPARRTACAGASSALVARTRIVRRESGAEGRTPTCEGASGPTCAEATARRPGTSASPGTTASAEPRPRARIRCPPRVGSAHPERSAAGFTEQRQVRNRPDSVRTLRPSMAAAGPIVAASSLAHQLLSRAAWRSIPG